MTTIYVNGTNVDDGVINDPPNGSGQQQNTNNTFIGGSGDDTIVAGPADAPEGIRNDNDVIVGGGGNDTLWGGWGNDKFVFNFTVQPASSGTTVATFMRDRPSDKADYKAWENYYKDLAAWRAEMVALHGADLDDATSLNTVTVHGGSAKKPSSATYDFSEDLTFEYANGNSTASISGEGHDTIMDWNNGNNQLLLNGLSNDSSLSNYWGNFLTSSQHGGDTVIHFTGGSITLVGVSTSIEDLVAGNKVLFG